MYVPEAKHKQPVIHVFKTFVFQRKHNVAYMELCKNRVGNDRYTDRMMQTLNGAPKIKEVQCDKIIMADKGK